MTRIYTKSIFQIILALVIMAGANGAWGQARESFTNIPTTSSTSYHPRSWIGDDGVTWTAEGARTDQTINGKAICFGNSGIRNVISPTYEGGMGTLTFNYVRGFTGTSARSLEVYVNGNKIGETIEVCPTSNEVNSYSRVNNIAGIVVLEIRSAGAAQVILDDISWTGYTTTDPTLSVTTISLSSFSYESDSGPSTSQSFALSGSNLDPVDAVITITTPANFEVSTDDVAFHNTRTLTALSGTIGSTSIFVRMKNGLDVDTYSGNVSISGGGATTQNVSVSGEVTSPPPPPLSINNSGFSYSQDFNTLLQSGSSNNWINNSTLEGWYSNLTEYIASTGTSLTGGMYSFGLDSDRALGALSSGSVSPIFGVQFQNNTGSAISLSDILVSYTGEQWRQTSNAQTLTFSYLVSSSLITDIAAGSYTNNGLLSFTAPNTGTAGAIDGNATENQKIFSYTSLNTSGEIAEGEYVMLRWSKSGSTSPGLAVDDFSLALATSASTISDGNWNTGATWAGAALPTPTSKATVSYDVTLSSEVEVFDLTVKTGKVLTISPSGSLTVHGTLTNPSGPSGLVIKSGGSLVHNTAGVEATMERDIIGTSGWGEEHAAVDWHLISSPVATQAISGIWAPTGTGNDYDFFGWKEGETAFPWRNQKVPANGITEFTPGLGYLTAYQQSGTKAFLGALNSGNVEAQIHFSGTAIKDWGSHQYGWNLLGNPYPSAINWSSAHGNQFEDNYAYVYNRNKSGGSGYEATTGMIAPNQGFFVKTESALTFTFTNAMRVHGGAFLKHMEPAQGLTLRLTSGDYYDETILLVNDMSGYERDRYDALKLFSFHADVPQVFSTTSDNIRVAINSIPDVTEETIIPVGIKVSSPGSYKMSLTGLAGRFENIDVYLVDKLISTEILLSEEESYLFDAEASESNVGEPRFELRFRSIAGTTSIAEFGTEEKARVFVSDNILHVHVSSEDASRMLEVYDVSGRLLMQQRLNDGLQHSLPLNLHSGIYLVRIQGQQLNQTERIFVR